MSGLVPTGTVTLLLADVEGSSRLWESQAEEMTAAFANLDRTVAQVVTTHAPGRRAPHYPIAYAQRGRGERKRPTSGWASLTPTERDVVRLVGQGLANRAIAARLFVSPRTVQTRLTHVYTKLCINSRVQLAQEAARHP